MLNDTRKRRSVAVIGAGPAGLMAAEALLQAEDSLQVQIDVYDAMPSVARKFLQAGKGGLNLTHSEPREAFLARYGSRQMQIAPLLKAFGPETLRAWAQALGIETFVGSSGRVFPQGMKAAPLLRSWLQRLRAGGVEIHVRHRWLGSMDQRNGIGFSTPAGEVMVHADAVILALGGGSWARLGSDGAWVPWLALRQVAVAPLRPANCGFDVSGSRWSEHFRARFAGNPVKGIEASFMDNAGIVHRRKGEFIVTTTGVEGSLIYALSSALRNEIEASGFAVLYVDLLPERDLHSVAAEILRPRGSRSLAGHLQSRLGIKGVKMGLLRELLEKPAFGDPQLLAAAIKRLPITLAATRPLDEAISSAGGVVFEELDQHLMIRSMPGVFCAGEMLDWEAPTGGYLLTACFASGRVAGLGALAWLLARS